MPPPTTDARTRILDAAGQLFHARGVSATGIDQILAASRTGKGQFYHYFRSKDDLVLQVMRHFRSKLASGQIPLKQDLATGKDLEEWFAFFLKAQADNRCARSCPIGTIAGELTDPDGPLRDEARAIFEGSREPLVRLFTSLRAQGRLKRSVDPRALADFCFTIMQGGLLVGKVERRTEPFENAVRHALAYVRSLQP
jgi:TetR/AcrR family transcriptional regulator, transcriptional repressor for nem operon